MVKYNMDDLQKILFLKDIEKVKWITIRNKIGKKKSLNSIKK